MSSTNRYCLIWVQIAQELDVLAENFFHDLLDLRDPSGTSDEDDLFDFFRVQLLTSHDGLQRLLAPLPDIIAELFKRGSVKLELHQFIILVSGSSIDSLINNVVNLETDKDG